MVMMGQYCVGDIPFGDVFIHAMIQDGQGRKMSKSLGNGIDPLVAIDSHGADAMRFALASMTTLTQDVRMPVEPMELPDGRTVNTSPKFDIGRNFCNKLWNASRFALTNLQDTLTGAFDESLLQLEDRWILSRLAQTIETVTGQLEEFKFSEPINSLYRFFWNELCDWYLELVKPRMREEGQKPTAQRVLAFVMDGCLRLFHPFLPFITEGIYQQLQAICPERDLDGTAELGGSADLVSARWPQAMPEVIDRSVEEQMDLVQNTIRLIRDIRTRYQVPPRNALKVSVKAGGEISEKLLGQQHLICHLANLSSFQAGTECRKPEHAATAVSEEMEIYVEGVIDVEAETERLVKQKEELSAALAGCEAKLNNENFVTRAKPEVVQRERDRLEQIKEQLATIQKNLDDLQ
jgi:valyl-tRNA synthetase